MKDIHLHINEEINKRNNSPIADFEGYSPNEIHFICRLPFEKESPIQILNTSSEIYEEVPIFKQVKFLFDLIKENKGLKLTARGFLPPKIVIELYGKGYIKDFFIEKGISKLYKEEGVDSIQLARILVELSSFTKKRKNVLSLTKKGSELVNSDQLLFQDILDSFTSKFNWAYFDNYQNEAVGQFGFGFSLILFAKYGHEYRSTDFYAEKYLKAFPLFQDEINVPLSSYAEKSSRAYALRTFDRFMDYFGLTEYEKERIDIFSTAKVRKTTLFDKLIKISPPKRN